MAGISTAIQSQLKDLEMMVAQSTESERHARAVVSSLREAIRDQLNQAYDEGVQDGKDAEFQTQQLGRRIYA